MERARTLAAKLGIDWLVHIDDDELLYSPTQRRVGEVLAAVPRVFRQAYVPNVEAVYESSNVKNCFSETREVNTNPYAFNSYANGKSAVRVASDDLIPAGPHQWKSTTGLDVSSVHLDREPFGAPLLVLHFESCPFVRWEDKFWELGNTSPDKVQAIPFQFYRESIARFQRCGRQSPWVAKKCNPGWPRGSTSGPRGYRQASWWHHFCSQSCCCKGGARCCCPWCYSHLSRSQITSQNAAGSGSP